MWSTALHLALFAPKENTLELLRVLIDGFEINWGAQTFAGTILHSLVVALRDSIFYPVYPSPPVTRLPDMSAEDEREVRENAVDMCRAGRSMGLT